MGTKYTTTTISGFNASPPSDDGTVTSDNLVKWSGVKTKLADPVKDAVESMDAKLVSLVDVGPSAKTANYTTVAGDHLKTIECTNTITISLLDAATATAGYTVGVFNAGTGTVTVSRATGADTINGTAGDITLAPKQGATVRVIAAATGYITIDSALPEFAGLVVTTAGKALLDDADAAAQRTTLNVGGLGTANTWSATQTFSSGDIAITSSGSPTIRIKESGTVDKDFWLTIGSGSFFIQERTDADVFVAHRMTVFGGGGVNVGSPTGGDKGAGTLNATAVYDDNTLLTCYVLEAERTGSVTQATWDDVTLDRVIPGRSAEVVERPVTRKVSRPKRTVEGGRVVQRMVQVDEPVFDRVPVVDESGKPVKDAGGKPEFVEVPRTVSVTVSPATQETVETLTHTPAARFAARAATLLDPEQYAASWKAAGHLPAMPSPVEWVAAGKKMAIGDLLQRLWETVECQAVHIEKLRERVVALENA